MSRKQRLSASVDAELVKAAEKAVSRGQAATVSAWVNDALRLKLEHDGRLQALAAFVSEYEAEHGEITEEEMVGAVRRARARAVGVRSLQGRETKRHPSRGRK
jgi:Arc/MetJ-type ribon-helix-helix transcriptional regulator